MYCICLDQLFIRRKVICGHEVTLPFVLSVNHHQTQSFWMIWSIFLTTISWLAVALPLRALLQRNPSTLESREEDYVTE